MNLAYEHYRVFRPNLSTRNEVMYFKPEVTGPIIFSRWIHNHYWANQEPHAWFPGDNYKGRFETWSINMWNEVTGIGGDKDYLMDNLGYLGSHDDYVAIHSEYPDSSIYNVLKYEGGFVGSHLYKEAVSINDDNFEFHYFHWWPRETVINWNKESIRTLFVGETGYKVKSFDNRVMCFKIYCNEMSGNRGLVNFAMESSLNENCACEDVVFYENLEVYEELYNKNSGRDIQNFGAIYSMDDNGRAKNTKQCFGILRHYDTEVNPIYE